MFLFSPFEIYSQTFPVQASVQLTPPYSLNLADYSSPESERLAFTILLADINRPELQVKFRLRIEGQGIEIQTSPSYNPPPYVLQGGIPERITGFDLAPYFNPANLEFRGVTRAQYLQTSKLPEGLYRLCIEVVEYNRNVVVSNTGCANAWLVLNDPPLVNVPANADKIRILNPQNIIFQWTPRHTGSPNAAFRTEYECTLVELWPATRNPNDAILSSPPILKETTSSTTFIYGPSETPLVAGRHYAFRVQAKSISGISQLDLFKNNGYTQVITFQYGDPCLAPEPVTATALDPERIKLEWTASAQHTEYAVEYRQAGSTQWYDQETYLPYTMLTNLRAGTSYEYQVKAVCGPVESEPGELKSATTKDLIPSSLVCGTSLPIFSLDNTQLLDQLNPGDVVTAGDFDVTIRKATGTGSFTGSGTVEVAFFKNAKVNVEFESIKVNPEYRLVEGKMEVKGIGVDVLGDNVTDLLDQLDDALITADDILKDVAADLDLADEILDEVGKLANDIADNGPFTTDQEAKLDGVTADKYLEEAEKAMKSVASALASAGSVGNTAEAARSVAQALTLRNRANKLKKIYAESDTLKVIAVEFVGTDNYGFDIQGYPQHRLHYNIMVTPDNVSTSVPWVSTKEGEASNVVARLLPSANIPAENIIFKAGESTLVANQNGNDWTVALPVAETGATLTVRAIDKTTGDTVGKLDVVTYSPIARKLNIVPVGTTTTLTAADVEAELDRIYKQAVADWDVTIFPVLSVPGYTGTLQDDKQALLSVYSDGMKEIIRTFEASGTYSKDEFYLFLVDNSQTGKAGYMPRKHRYGFIYQNANTDPIRTISHELGHGAFRLQHIAEEYPTIGKVTENLMDSAGTGPLLRKYQWDLIHNPSFVIGLLEDEGEGALIDNKDGIEVEFVKASESFTPGVDKLIIEYEFKNLKVKLREHSDKVFRASIQIRDKNKSEVFKREIPVEETGRIEWDGFLNRAVSENEAEEKIWFDNGPYTVQIKIYGGLETGWDEFLAFLGNPIDWFTGELETSVSGYGETQFNVDEDREKLENFRLKPLFESLYSGENGLLETYKTQFVDKRDVWLASMEKVGLMDTHPFDYISENVVEKGNTFLGGNVGPANIRFMLVLKLIEQKIKEDGKWELFKRNSGFYSAYVNVRMKSLKGEISNHCLGFGMDIDDRKNPQIASSNIYNFIRLVTGSRLNGYTFEGEEYKMEQAYDDFIARLKIPKNNVTEWTKVDDERISNVNSIISNLTNFIDKIKTHEGNKDVYQIVDLEKNTIKYDLINYLNLTETRLKSKDFDRFKSESQLIKSKLLEFNDYLKNVNGVFFIQYHTTEFLKIENYFDKISSDFEMLFNITSIESLTPELASNLLEKIEELKSTVDTYSDLDNILSLEIERQRGWIKSLDEYKKLLLSLDKNDNVTGGSILYWGFWALQKELTNYLDNLKVDISQIDASLSGPIKLLRWGGNYRNEHDWMHFEVSQGDDGFLTQRTINQLPLEEVVEKINSLSDEKYIIITDNSNGKKVRYCKRAN